MCVCVCVCVCFALVSGGCNRHLLGFRGTKCAFWAFSLDIILIMINNNNNNISFIASHLVCVCVCVCVSWTTQKVNTVHSIAQLQLQFTVCQLYN